MLWTIWLVFHKTLQRNDSAWNETSHCWNLWMKVSFLGFLYNSWASVVFGQCAVSRNEPVSEKTIATSSSWMYNHPSAHSWSRRSLCNLSSTVDQANQLSEKADCAMMRCLFPASFDLWENGDRSRNSAESSKAWWWWSCFLLRRNLHRNR